MRNEDRLFSNNGMNKTGATIKHGYQPSGKLKSINEGYIPKGTPSSGEQSMNTVPSNPPSGGTVQQDK